MARTNNIWVVVIYKNIEKTEYFKTLKCETLEQIAYLIDKKVYDVSNVFHKITKPNGVFKYITIYKTGPVYKNS